MTVSLIITNAKILTMDREKPRAEAIAVSGNRIRMVGDAASVLRLKESSAQVIDAVNVIGVLVREKHRVDIVDGRRHELQAQLGRGIDQQPGTVTGFDERAAA